MANMSRWHLPCEWNTNENKQNNIGRVGRDMLMPAERDGPNSIVISFFNFRLLEE